MQVGKRIFIAALLLSVIGALILLQIDSTPPQKSPTSDLNQSSPNSPDVIDDQQSEIIAESPTNAPEASQLEESTQEVDASQIETGTEILTAQATSEAQDELDFQMMNPNLVNQDTESIEALEITISDVNWDSARQHAPLPVSLLSPEQIDIVKQAPLPVLLPPQASLLSTGVITMGNSWYTASLYENNVNVVIEGSTAAVNLSENSSGSGIGTFDTYSIQRSLGMTEVAFEAFGVVYTVTVECAGQNNSACSSDHYISDIVNSLLYANGVEERDGA